MVKAISVTFKKPSVVIHDTPTQSVWVVASQLAEVLSGPVEFKVEWANGEAYEGTANILPRQGYDFAHHIRTYAETYTGKVKPAHLSPEQYKAGMTKVPKATAAKLNKILAECDLTETPRVTDDPAPSNVVNLREFRFANIPQSKVEVQVEDRTALLNDGTFPPPPKDVDNFEAPMVGALVYNFKLPQGRA